MKKAEKIKGIKERWSVVEIPVTIKIEDYTEAATFLGIDLNAFGENPGQNDWGNTTLLLLGKKSLQNMKDSNDHAISKKQQEKYLAMGENLRISYLPVGITKETSSEAENLSSVTDNSGRKPQITYLPCKVATVMENEEIYIPLSQAQELCCEMGEPLKITKLYLKVDGKKNLERAKQLFE